VEIPLDEEAPADITDQVASYFGIGAEAELEVATANFVQE